MKFIWAVWMASAFLLNSAGAFAFTPATDEFLTTAQRETVLQVVDQLCGDTWCEGDYGFAFDDLKCSAQTQTCELFFRMTAYVPKESSPAVIEDEQYTAKIFKAPKVSCVIHATQYSDLVEAVHPTYVRLTDHYYGALSSCILALEERL
jgi:hypothetical protein